MNRDDTLKIMRGILSVYSMFFHIVVPFSKGQIRKIFKTNTNEWNIVIVIFHSVDHLPRLRFDIKNNPDSPLKKPVYLKSIRPLAIDAMVNNIDNELDLAYIFSNNIDKFFFEYMNEVTKPEYQNIFNMGSVFSLLDVWFEHNGMCYQRANLVIPTKSVLDRSTIIKSKKIEDIYREYNKHDAEKKIKKLFRKKGYILMKELSDYLYENIKEK